MEMGMLPNLRFTVGAMLATALLVVTAFGIAATLRLAREAKTGPLETSRSLAYTDQTDWNQFTDPTAVRRYEEAMRPVASEDAPPVTEPAASLPPTAVASPKLEPIAPDITSVASVTDLAAVVPPVAEVLASTALDANPNANTSPSAEITASAAQNPAASGKAAADAALPSDVWDRSPCGGRFDCIGAGARSRTFACAKGEGSNGGSHSPDGRKRNPHDHCAWADPSAKGPARAETAGELTSVARTPLDPATILPEPLPGRTRKARPSAWRASPRPGSTLGSPPSCIRRCASSPPAPALHQGGCARPSCPRAAFVCGPSSRHQSGTGAAALRARRNCRCSWDFRSRRRRRSRLTCPEKSRQRCEAQCGPAQQSPRGQFNTD